MTTMRSILTSAIRWTRARPLGDDPGAEEMDAALEEAQALVLTLTARALTDVLITADYEAGENERITWVSGSPTVTRPTTIGTGVDARPPLNGSLVEVTGTSPTRHIYVSELKTWMPLHGLALTSEQPFGPSLDEGFTAMIAVRLCGSVFQRETPADVAERAITGRARFDASFAPAIAAAVDPGLRTRTYLLSDDWNAQ